MSFQSDFMEYTILKTEMQIKALTDDESRNYLKFQTLECWVSFVLGAFTAALVGYALSFIGVYL